MKKIIAIAFIIVLFSSCNRNSNKNDQSDIFNRTLSIKTSKNNDCKIWDELITDMEFVPLETNDSCLIDEIDKLLIAKNRIFILTRHEEIFVFNEVGQFIKKVGTKGKGPLEILKPFDISISIDNYLYILDVGKIIKSDLNGNILSEKYFNNDYLGSNPVNLYVYDDLHMFAWKTATSPLLATHPYHLYAFDNNFKKKQGQIPYSHFSLSVVNRFSQCGDGQVAIAPNDLNDTIYSIKNGEIKPTFVIDINNGEKKKLKPLLASSIDDYRFPNQLSKFVADNNLKVITNNVVFNDEYITFSIRTSTDSYRLIYNYKNDSYETILCYAYGERRNLFSPGITFGSYNNLFYSSINANQTKDAISNGDTICSFLTPNKKHKLVNKLKAVNEADNPIIMIFRLHTGK